MTDSETRAARKVALGDVEFVMEELRMFARNATGIPPAVSVTAETLTEWAEMLEESEAKRDWS